MKTNTKHWAGITAGILSLAGYASAASLGSEKYTYDASGNIIEKSIDGMVTKMSYDKSNRITNKQVNGRSSETISYDAASRPVAEHDANGRQVRNITYGYGDKVLETKKQDSEAEFYYNAEGSLVGKKNDRKIVTYAWDGIALAAQDSAAYTNEAHITGATPLIAGENEVVVSDYLGTTLLQGQRAFNGSAYGEGLESGRFTSKVFVQELGEYVFPHRNYSPITNRWTRSDPSGFPDGANNSAYVNGDPISRFDVLGLTLQFLGGTLVNSTNCIGSGWSLDFAADGMTSTVTGGTVGPAPYIRTTFIYSEYAQDLAIGAAAVLVGGTATHVNTGVTTFTIPAGTDSTSADVSDADDFTGSAGGTPGFICGAAGAANIIPIPRHIGWATLTVYEH